MRILDGLLGEDLGEAERREAQYSRARSRHRARDWDGCVDDMRVLYEVSATQANRDHLGRCLRYGGRYAEAATMWASAAKASKNAALAETFRWQAVAQSVNGADYSGAQACKALRSLG